MSVPKQKRETDTRWEINEEDEGAVEIEAGETKEKKKKCVAETNTKKRRKNQGKSKQVDLEIWGVLWVFLFRLVSIFLPKHSIYPDMSKTTPIQPVFKPKKNKSISVPA